MSSIKMQCESQIEDLAVFGTFETWKHINARSLNLNAFLR